MEILNLQRKKNEKFLKNCIQYKKPFVLDIECGNKDILSQTKKELVQIEFKQLKSITTTLFQNIGLTTMNVSYFVDVANINQKEMNEFLDILEKMQ